MTRPVLSLTPTGRPKRIWRTPAEVRRWAPKTATGYATNSANFIGHFDFTTPAWRKFLLDHMVIDAIKRGWRGYCHVACVLTWMETGELPEGWNVIKPKGPYKCAVCKEHRLPAEAAA